MRGEPPKLPYGHFHQVNFFGRPLSKAYGPIYYIWHCFYSSRVSITLGYHCVGGEVGPGTSGGFESGRVGRVLKSLPIFRPKYCMRFSSPYFDHAD